MLLGATAQDPRPALSLLQRELAGDKEKVRNISNKLRLFLWWSQEEKEFSHRTLQISFISRLHHPLLCLTPPLMRVLHFRRLIWVFISVFLCWKQGAYHLSEKRHQGGSQWFGFFSFEFYCCGFRCGISFFAEIHCL